MQGLHVLYINVADAVARRTQLESSFREFAPPSVRLERIEAVTSEEVVSRNIPGAIRAAEKACLLSHRKALEKSLTVDGDVLIVEDDALFGPSTFRELLRLAPILGTEVDVMFTSALMGDVVGLLQQFLMYRELMSNRQIRVLDLAPIRFTGADAYFIRNKSKVKLIKLLESREPLDTPYDILLRSFVQTARIKAVLAFPFLTLLSPLADISQLGNSNPSIRAFNCLRRMLAMDADYYAEPFQRALDDLGPGPQDEQAEGLARIVRFIFSNAPRAAASLQRSS